MKKENFEHIIRAESDITKCNDLIEGAIGELSDFHQEFGYYAQGVDEGTAYLPKGWEERLIEVNNENTGYSSTWCIEPHDCAVSKIIAGREKDKSFVFNLMKYSVLSSDCLKEKLLSVSGLSQDKKILLYMILKI